MDVLVVDVGGSQVKVLVSGASEPRRFESSPELTPDALVRRVIDLTRGWDYEVVSLGYPGVVGPDGPMKEPGNLGTGWVGFDFQNAFDKPVRVVNDAVMHALGGYEGGRMLFLGLGTGLGSALVSDHVIIPMELGDLPDPSGEPFGDRLGRRGFEGRPRHIWIAAVHEIAGVLRHALAADYVLLGGGNARHVDRLPEHTRRAAAAGAFTGGFRLWEETVEPHDRRPPLVWRVVR